ncbi:MAG: aryl-sulfate sulfotransferase [Rikenellaceae bacterium]
MKKITYYLLLMLAFVGCSDDNDNFDSSFSGDNYITINGSIMGVSLTKSEVYYPLSLASDSYNLLSVNVDPDYIISINGVEYANGSNYQLMVDELSSQIRLDFCIENRSSGEVLTSYIATLPQSSIVGEVTSNNPPEGFYYLAYANAIFKLSTLGEVVYYKLVNNANLFNRTEIDGVVYYSYLEETFSSEFEDVDDTGSRRSQAVVMDEHYQEIDVVGNIIATETVGALPLDNHQFHIIDLGHYLISAYNEKVVYNIPNLEDGVSVYETIIQEIKDGELIFNWESSLHPEFYDLFDYREFSYDSVIPFDYLHFNSVMIDPSDGNFVVSFRALSSIIKMDRESGEIIWVLGGKGDYFDLDADATMIGQHDAWAFGDGVYTIFNNNYYSEAALQGAGESIGGEYSGAIKYFLDEQNFEVLSYERYESDSIQAFAEGSAQEIATGHYLMCWGMPFSSDYIFTDQNFITGELYFGLGKISSEDAYKVLKYDK